MLSANFSRLFVFASFELNRDYIAAELCVNKDKPQLHCNGQCYLSKKLEEAAKKEKKQEKELQKSCFQEAFISKVTSIKIFQEVLDTINTPEPQFCAISKLTSIFHPPKA